ncbi:SipW-dependent-type signal peptide-containing protein [Arthrobacter sp. B1805]|uniref:SipW-dependent-type signal peptide-containing protein n=1 Tax=Arthrobacter sp. B1805 TaxID=2058892 RepID=UPI000CE55762|nr:SipW-dependent-type signal peptide-containing protein [Arthrobacter sp. B1805]
MNDVPQLKRRRVRAVLAGGLVLGVGAAVTLAAWNDSEFATGSFAGGQFNLVGSTDGTNFTDHATATDAADLGFVVDADELTPNDVVYAPFAVALDGTTSYGATVTVSSEALAGSLKDLTYELLQTTGFGCTATTTGTALVPAGTALGTVPAGVTFSLEEATGTALAPANLCFKVTAGDIAQGISGSATWEFAAESLS